MRFTKINSITKTAAVFRTLLALAAFFVCLWPRIADAQIRGYTIQIAALRSQQGADELTQGLTSRGINAYWIKGASLAAKSDHQQFYRVRIGKFNTIESACGYAEQLLNSGLFDAYAIAAYEPPNARNSKIRKRDEVPAKVQSFTPRKESKPEQPERPERPERIDLVVAIGSRGWLLLSSQNVLARPPKNTSALSRELARLAAAIGSRGWSLNRDIAKLFTAPVQAAPPARPVDFAAANPLPVNVAQSRVAPVPPVTRASSTNISGISAPEVGRRPAPPATSSGNATSARGSAYAAPPRLQGTIEMRDGRMWMRLRNTDSSRSFTGLARITLSDEKNQQDVAPLQFTLSPDREESFPIDEATLINGNWILLVYDENGAARLVRGASLAPQQQSPAQNAVARNAPQANQPAPATQGPPGYVTGFYDATSSGWATSQSDAPPSLALGQARDNGLTPVSGNQNSTANAQSENAPATAPAPAAEVAPGQVTVVPRQIAITAENITMEFDLSAPVPLNYIVVTLRAGEFQDTRQALMSTPVGRVPFLIPIQHTSTGFFYEIKDEAQRVLASGNGDFRNLSRRN